jgi:hypothetical protein
VRLLDPSQGCAGFSRPGDVCFYWQRGQERLPDGYGYELVFWHPGAPGDKRGPAGTIDSITAEVTMQARVNLVDQSANVDFRGILLGGQDFCWGVRAWDRVNNRGSILLSGECRRYRYEGPAPQDDAPQDVQPPAPAPPENLERPTPTAPEPVPIRPVRLSAHNQDFQGE